MLAFRMKIADAYRGVTVQIYLIVEFTNIQVHQRAKVEEPIGVHYNINDLRRISGIDDIYAIYDAKEWNVYYGLITQHINELHATEELLKNDPVIQKDIADHKNDMKAFRIWQSANKWEV